jgi:hypothetical protein
MRACSLFYLSAKITYLPPNNLISDPKYAIQKAQIIFGKSGWRFWNSSSLFSVHVLVTIELAFVLLLVLND